MLGSACAVGRGYTSKREIGRQSCTLSPELPVNSNRTSHKDSGGNPHGAGVLVNASCCSVQDQHTISHAKHKSKTGLRIILPRAIKFGGDRPHHPQCKEMSCPVSVCLPVLPSFHSLTVNSLPFTDVRLFYCEFPPSLLSFADITPLQDPSFN